MTPEKSNRRLAVGNKLRLLLWWIKYHWLNIRHITDASASARVRIVMKMIAHDARHPNGSAPKWEAGRG